MVIAVALAFVYLGFTVGLSNFYQVPFLTSVSDNDRGNNRNHLRRRQLSSSKNSDYVLFQKCKDSGEAYSASYLITREHLEYQFTDYNLTWVNCEMGSFIMMNGRANPDKNINGSIVQSVDVLDLSVIHLSTYERLLRRWAHSVRSDPSAKAGNIASVVASAKMLRERALILRGPDIPMEHPAYNRTVVIMPFLGSDMGAGHSKLSNRLQYLSACFWSFYAVYPHVVAAVKNEKDREFARTTSGLPFFDVMLLPDLPKSASLPVGTVQETKRRIVNGSWSDMFDYVFFTESDQILMMRLPHETYAYLDKYPRHLMVPHRLMAYPAPILTMHHKRAVSTSGPVDWMDLQCCLPRQHCTERKNWEHVSNDSAVPLLNIYGIQVPLGNSNFHAETYRTCNLTVKNGREHICP